MQMESPENGLPDNDGEKNYQEQAFKKKTHGAI